MRKWFRKAAPSTASTPDTTNDPSMTDTRRMYELACEVAGHYITRDLEERRWRRIKRAALLGFFALSVGTWIALYGPMLGWSAGPTEKSVGVIPIQGEIGGSLNATADALVPVIESACKSPLIHTVVLQVSSPGGSPSEAERIAGALASCKPSGTDAKPKPVIAVIETVGASAAYMIAMRADEVVASKYALVGSIGAVMRSFDASGALARHGIRERVYASGALKSSNSPWATNTPEQDANNQALVEQVGDVFKADVMAARGTRLKPTADIFNGRAWLGGEAVRLGLADRVGTFEELKADRFPDLKVHHFRPRQTFQDRIGLRAMAHELGAGFATALTRSEIQ